MKSLRPLTSSLLQTSRQQPYLRARFSPFLQPTNHNRQTTRQFTFNPFSSEPEILTATRTLAYPPKAIYAVISDVASYAHFIPYCQSSIVTNSSEPTKYDGKTYPEEAKLMVGFSNDIAEEFWSRVYCSPERMVVEAVSGTAETSLAAAEIAHHHARPAVDQDPTRKGDVLSHLSTRWTLKPGPQETEVNLAIEYRFANPMYAALSQAAAPKVAEKMIEAFEGRVKKVAEGAVNS